MSLEDLQTSGRLAVVFGNESDGVRPAMRESAHEALAVPLWGGAESLNVAAAAAIVLYEIARKKRCTGGGMGSGFGGQKQ